MEPRPAAARRRPARDRNRIDPYALNDLDQRMLKESFRQARVAADASSNGPSGSSGSRRTAAPMRLPFGNRSRGAACAGRCRPTCASGSSRCACVPGSARATGPQRHAGPARRWRASWRWTSRRPGPNMHVDRIISIGGVAVAERAVRHADAFEVVVRQEQRERGRQHPRPPDRRPGAAGRRGAASTALLSFLEYLDGSVAWPSAPSSTRRSCAASCSSALGIRARTCASSTSPRCCRRCFRARRTTRSTSGRRTSACRRSGATTRSPTPTPTRSCCCCALEQAQRVGMTTAGDLLDLEKAQRWLGRRR